MRRLVLCLGLVAACVPEQRAPSVETTPGVALQHLRTAAAAQGTFVAVDLLTTDGSGQPLPCDDAVLTLDAEVSYDGQSWTPLAPGSVQTSCGSDAPRDVALVLDGSGSQADAADLTRAGAHGFVDDVLAAGGRVGVVHLASTIDVASPLSSTLSEAHAAIDDFEVRNGWTALYDGIRVGNEMLGQALGTTTPPAFGTLAEFCGEHRRFGVVAFTNGQDNNSADENTDPGRGDGIDTRLDDLFDLRVSSVSTPVYTIGLGDEVATDLLARVASATGGRHLAVSGSAAVPDAFGLLASYPDTTLQVCAEVAQSGCGLATLRISYDLDIDGTVHSDTTEYTVHVACPLTQASGRTATMLLTLTDPGIDAATSTALIDNTVEWVSPAAAPSVLVVRDDNHRNEDIGDTPWVEDVLVDAGYDVTWMEEPSHGLEPSDLAGYDVVWFSNPGWPMDDPATFDALSQFSGVGGGVVLQGDDLSWSMGNAFPLTALTRLDHVDNGTRTCGVRTDNNRGGHYRVDVGAGPHPVIAGLEGASFRYGNDIDHSSARNEGEQVLAWAGLDGDPTCSVRVPVIVAWEP